MSCHKCLNDFVISRGLSLAVFNNETMTCFQIFCLSTPVCRSCEGLETEVVQVITGINFTSILTPQMASKNDGRQGIGLVSVRTTRFHVRPLFFDAISGVKNLPEIHTSSHLQNLGL